MNLEKTKIGFVILVFLFINMLFSCSNKEKQEVNKKDISTPVVVYAKVDKVNSTIGDTLTYELTINKAQKIKVTEPDIRIVLSEFDIVKEDKKPEKEVDDRLVQTWTYKFQIKNLGSYSINPVEVTYTIPKELETKYGKSGITKTSKIYLEIKSVLEPEDKNKDIEDIKPIDEIQVLSKITIFFILLAFIIVIVALYFIIKRFLKPLPPPLPHETAFKELDMLNNKDLLNKGKFKDFYFDLSEIMRKYLQNRFEILALENTSEILQKEVNKIEEINSDQKVFINSFVETTDFYKFTDFESSKDKAIELFKSSQQFVSETKKLPEKEEKKK